MLSKLGKSEPQGWNSHLGFVYLPTGIWDCLSLQTATPQFLPFMYQFSGLKDKIQLPHWTARSQGPVSRLTNLYSGSPESTRIKMLVPFHLFCCLTYFRWKKISIRSKARWLIQTLFPAGPDHGWLIHTVQCLVQVLFFAKRKQWDHLKWWFLWSWKLGFKQTPFHRNMWRSLSHNFMLPFPVLWRLCSGLTLNISLLRNSCHTIHLSSARSAAPVDLSNHTCWARPFSPSVSLWARSEELKIWNALLGASWPPKSLFMEDTEGSFLHFSLFLCSYNSWEPPTPRIHSWSWPHDPSSILCLFFLPPFIPCNLSEVLSGRTPWCPFGTFHCVLFISSKVSRIFTLFLL